MTIYNYCVERESHGGCDACELRIKGDCFFCDGYEAKIPSAWDIEIVAEEIKKADG
jgi:hypothetical protein